MAKINSQLKQYALPATLTLITLAALATLSQSLQEASSFAGTYAIVLLVAVGGVVILLFTLLRMLWRLRKQLKQRRPGSRIVLRLSLLITALVGVPVLVIYLFALQFLYQGIDAWFDIKTETALQSATQLTRSTLDDKTRTLLNLTRSSTQLFQNALIQQPALALDKIRQLINAEEVALFKDDKQLIAFSAGAQGANILPHTPPENLFQQAQQGRAYAAIDTHHDTVPPHPFYRILLPLEAPHGRLILQAIFPVSAQLTQLAKQVETATEQYQQRAYLREPLKTTMALILSLVVLLALVSALLFAIQLVQHTTRPLRMLTKGTRRIAEGQLEPINTELPKNELGELIRSFNDMVFQIKRARHTARLGHQQMALQKAYLQTIINSLNSGVMTLDARQRLRLFNQQAEALLECPLHTIQHQKITDAIRQDAFKPLAMLWQHIAQEAAPAKGSWQQQLPFATPTGERILLVQGAPLPGEHQGSVLIFDDITALVQAQRHAAWHDVARRLAHEIKNPLTPIQLSAERLALKLSPHLPTEQRALLEKLTATIVAQVKTMQTLVDAFTDYAHSPTLEKRPLALNELVDHMVQLYTRPGITFSTALDDNCPLLEADPNRMNQLLHNLIKNALEACENVPAPHIRIATHCKTDQMTLSICDNGGKLKPEDTGWIFEPYASDKPKGSGLGLAVAKKIVEEHNGLIEVQVSEGQTCFILTFPLTAPL